jgi:putative membrane protein
VPFDENEDATRRTRLANERTYLAWWRTGLTSFAVCIGVGRVVPGVSHVTRWPYEAVGAGYGLLGIAFMTAGHLRIRKVEQALQRGEFLHVDDRLMTAVLVAGLVLGVATVALVLFGG